MTWRQTRSFIAFGRENRLGSSGPLATPPLSAPPERCSSMNASTHARWIPGSTRSRVVHDRILFPVYASSSSSPSTSLRRSRFSEMWSLAWRKTRRKSSAASALARVFCRSFSSRSVAPPECSASFGTSPRTKSSTPPPSLSSFIAPGFFAALTISFHLVRFSSSANIGN